MHFKTKRAFGIFCHSLGIGMACGFSAVRRAPFEAEFTEKKQHMQLPGQIHDTEDDEDEHSSLPQAGLLAGHGTVGCAFFLRSLPWPRTDPPGQVTLTTTDLLGVLAKGGGFVSALAFHQISTIEAEKRSCRGAECFWGPGVGQNQL